MPEDVMMLLDQFLRDMTSLNVGVFDLAYILGPEPAMTIIRNRNGDPVEQAATVLHIVRQAVTDGRIEEHPLKPLN